MVGASSVIRAALAILLIAFALHGDAGAWTHGVASQSSGANLTSGIGEFLKSGGGDQLVSQ